MAYSGIWALKTLSVLSDPQRICHTVIYFLANGPGSLGTWFPFSNSTVYTRLNSLVHPPTRPAALSQASACLSSELGWALTGLERQKNKN